jgi:DNA-directed RNA polymerase III subunit RPC6
MWSKSCNVDVANLCSLDTLTKDEHLVYTRIQHADNQGIWSQNLSKNLNMGKVVLDKCLKSLESKRIIKRVKSVKVCYNSSS